MGEKTGSAADWLLCRPKQFLKTFFKKVEKIVLKRTRLIIVTWILWGVRALKICCQKKSPQKLHTIRLIDVWFLWLEHARISILQNVLSVLTIVCVYVAANFYLARFSFRLRSQNNPLQCYTVTSSKTFTKWVVKCGADPTNVKRTKHLIFQCTVDL
jgi:hypothetical protein